MDKLSIPHLALHELMIDNYPVSQSPVYLVSSVDTQSLMYLAFQLTLIVNSTDPLIWGIAHSLWLPHIST